MKRIILSAVIGLFITGCRQSDLNGDLEISIPVSIQEIRPGSIEEFITTTTTVYAIKNTVLMSEIEGTYRRGINPRTKNPFAVGDQVRTGDVIVFLDNPEYENNIKIDAQKLNLDISQREYEKQQSLYDKGGVTLRELKNAERTFIEARYAYQNALIQLQKMKTRAPFDGVVIDLPYYTPGTRVMINQRMAEVMDYSKLYGEVFFPANELNRIRIGQPLRVTHYSLSEDTLWGEVTQVSPALNPETRSFKAHILVDNHNQALRPGMFVQVETIVARKDSVIVIPKEIVLSRREGKTVFIVDKGAAFERIISGGLENDDQIEVLEGLNEGDRLVIRGFESLQNRSKIKIVSN